MAGIKISQLPRWSFNELERLDTSNIIIPVSVANNNESLDNIPTTGAIKVNTLIHLFKKMSNSDDIEQNENISYLNSQVSYLYELITDSVNEINNKYDELVEFQQNVDTQQTSQISQNTETISYIQNINDSQTEQINLLSAWEVYE